MAGQREFKMKVVGMDRRSDIALLKISAKDLPVVSIGDSSKLEMVEWVVAIGFRNHIVYICKLKNQGAPARFAGMGATVRIDTT
jgi:hypothetical protein